MTTVGELQIFVESADAVAALFEFTVLADARFRTLDHNLRGALAAELSVELDHVVGTVWDLDIMYEFGDGVDRAYRELKEHCDGWLGRESLDDVMTDLYLSDVHAPL